MNEDSFIKELGRSYIVSSFLPSALFVSLLLILFRGFIPAKLISELPEGGFFLVGQWVLVSVFTIWIAFFLFSSVDWIVKLFEGYYLPFFLKNILSESYAEQVRKRASSYFKIRDIKRKPPEKRTQREKNEYHKNWAAAYGELQELEIEAPFDDKDFMPTRLGNVLKASEVYANERYLIEAITIWPRLFSLLPSGFVKDMEEKNNHFMFLLNSTLLIYVCGALCLASALIGFYYDYCAGWLFCNILRTQHILHAGFSLISPKFYLLASIVLISFGYRLYRIAVNAAQDFGLFYRAGFDLYRTELLKHLHHRLPKNLTDEREAWLTLSTFFIAGERLEWDPEKLKPTQYYYHKLDRQKKESDNER